jgi:ABC-type uncharacterized transport system ATPase subunit
VANASNYCNFAQAGQKILLKVEMPCDTVDILHHGKLVQSGAVSDFVHTQNVVEIVLPESHVASDIVIQPGIAEHVVEMQTTSFA